MDNSDLVLKRLRDFGQSAYDFIHEADGHPAVLLYADVEAHIKEMWRLWNLLTGTWNEFRRYSREYMNELCSGMRNKPIRTKGKIHPLKSIWQIANQENRMMYGLHPGTPRYEKLQSIFRRYYQNIQNTEEYKEAFQLAYDFAFNDITRTHIAEDIRDAEAKTSGYGRADRIKFPREVYAV